MEGRLINIGYGNIVAAHRLLVIVNPESAPIKRMVAEAREAGRIIDGTLGAVPVRFWLWIPVM